MNLKTGHRTYTGKKPGGLKEVAARGEGGNRECFLRWRGAKQKQLGIIMKSRRTSQR